MPFYLKEYKEQFHVCHCIVKLVVDVGFRKVISYAFFIRESESN